MSLATDIADAVWTYSTRTIDPSTPVDSGNAYAEAVWTNGERTLDPSAGHLTVITTTITSVTLSWTAATGTYTPIVAQLQISLHGADSWSDSDGTGLTTGTVYDFRVRFTDAQSTVVYSNVVTATAEAGESGSAAQSTASSAATSAAG